MTDNIDLDFSEDEKSKIESFDTGDINAEVISVYPDKVSILVNDLKKLSSVDEVLRVGSYLRISDDNDVVLIASIENFSISATATNKRHYLIEACPLGVIRDNIFTRGGDSIAIPPKKVEVASRNDINRVFDSGLKDKNKFFFSKLSTHSTISIPVDGDKFFNKHIAITGSTGSGKSHTVARIINNAMLYEKEKNKQNNSHIVIFDLHSEYASAFPHENLLSIHKLNLPYWLMNDEELEEMFLESGDNNNYNQSSLLRKIITKNKIKYNSNIEKIFFDSPVYFNIQEVTNYLINLSNETINAKDRYRIMLVDDSYEIKKDGGIENEESGLLLDEEDKDKRYFESVQKFHPQKNANISKGDYADGSINKFISRIESKISQERLRFLFSEETSKKTFQEVIENLLGFKSKSNVTVIDLSGIPFEVLSVTVSLVSRIIFDFGYIYKKSLAGENQQNLSHELPILLVYEEAHKYVPKSDLGRYKSSKTSLERIAKEGRKYGVTMLISTQRPSEISDTIFSQCSNYVSMRLTNPVDQGYIRKILPDSMGDLSNSLSALKTGEALIMGDAVLMPSLVMIDPCDEEYAPSSNDIPYLEIWKKSWYELELKTLCDSLQSK
ncbi:TPA: ATP-binding protein [Yersinia enterocolitica]